MTQDAEASAVAMMRAALIGLISSAVLYAGSALA
jgi:hypothetical protein